MNQFYSDKNKVKGTSTYLAPQVEIIDFQIEKGFAATALEGFDPTNGTEDADREDGGYL